MAARKQLWHPDETKKRIKTSQLINRLQDFALLDMTSEDAPKKTMTPAQVSAAASLLKKTLPDLQPIDADTGKAGLTVHIGTGVRDL